MSSHRNVLLRSAFLLCLSIFTLSSVCAQNEPVKKNKTYLYLDAYQNTGGSKKLVATLKTKVDKKFVLMNDQNLIFTLKTDTNSIVLGEVRTNAEGSASLEIAANKNLAMDEKGFHQFEVTYDGDDLHKAKTGKVKIKDIDFSTELSVQDDVKFVKIEASELDLEGNRIPVNDVDVEIFVQRMFSQFKVGEATLEDGKCEFVFPNDIPGDSVGTLKIYAKIIDHR